MLLIIVSCSDKIDWIDRPTLEDLVSSSSENISSSSEEGSCSSSEETSSSSSNEEEDDSSSSGEENSSSSEENNSSSSETPSSSSAEELSSSSEISSSSSEVSSSSVHLEQCGENIFYDPNEYDDPDCNHGAGILMAKCGSYGYYNTGLEFCYKDSELNSQLKSLCGGDKYKPAEEFCAEDGIVKKLCNGKEFVEAEGEYCYNNTEVRNRCDNVPYNVETHACCGIRIYLTGATQFCENNELKDICGTRPEKFDPDLYECRESNKIYLKTKLKDTRDGTQEYEAVLIGTQTWMAENLNYAVEGSLCYNNDPDNCVIYGRLYNWSTAMDGAASSTANPSGVQGICPADWHLPSDAEWTALTTYVGGEETAAKKLKSTSDLWTSHATAGGTDEFGFAGLPGGNSYFYNIYRFYMVGETGYWWSATNVSFVIQRNMSYQYEKVFRNNYNDDSQGYWYSVRCVKD